MIACPPGWSSESLRGGWLFHSPPLPTGESAAELRYSEGMRPVLTPAAVVREVLLQQPAFCPREQSRPELFLTAEGEYVVLVRVSGHLGGRPIWHLISAIYGEESMNVLDAIVREPAALPAVAHLVRELVYADQLGLGVRKRRFLYAPPAGWQPRPRGLLCSWYPPDHLQHPAALVAHPAMPRDGSPEAVVETFLKVYQSRGFVVEAMTDGEPVTTDAGLHGKAFCLVGRFPSLSELTCDLLVLADARYLYSLILETEAPAHRAALQDVLPAVARSVRPIPMPVDRAASDSPSSPSDWSF